MLWYSHALIPTNYATKKQIEITTQTVIDTCVGISIPLNTNSPTNVNNAAPMFPNTTTI